MEKREKSHLGNCAERDEMAIFIFIYILRYLKIGG